jgi:hypothetical protein
MLVGACYTVGCGFVALYFASAPLWADRRLHGKVTRRV